MNFADVPKSVTPRAIDEIEQPPAVGMERRPVVEHDRRVRREHRDEPVPHHPAAAS